MADELAQRLREAAKVIADRAKANASGWSARIPPSIKVRGGGLELTVSCAAPPAYPNETGARHPVYAQGPDRRDWTWVKGNHRPFLAPAADEKADAAMARYAEKIDKLARAAGFK